MTPSFDVADLLRRVEELEGRLDGELPLDNLPLADLQRHLEVGGSFIPNACLMLEPHSICADLMGVDSVTTEAIKAGTILDTDLASPNNVTRKTAMVAGSMVAGEAAASYFMMGWNAAGGPLVQVSTNIATYAGVGVQYLDPADFAVAGKLTRFRIQAALLASEATARTYQVALREITAVTSTAAFDLGLTAGADYAGSATGTVAPGATSMNHLVGSDFAITAAGYYGLVVNLVGASPANERQLITATLQVHNV